MLGQSLRMKKKWEYLPWEPTLASWTRLSTSFSISWVLEIIFWENSCRYWRSCKQRINTFKTNVIFHLGAATQELPRAPHTGGSWSSPWEPVRTYPYIGNSPACPKNSGRLGSCFWEPRATFSEPPAWRPHQKPPHQVLFLGSCFWSRFSWLYKLSNIHEFEAKESSSSLETPEEKCFTIDQTTEQQEDDHPTQTSVTFL